MLFVTLYLEYDWYKTKVVVKWSERILKWEPAAFNRCHHANRFDGSCLDHVVPILLGLLFAILFENEIFVWFKPLSHVLIEYLTFFFSSVGHKSCSWNHGRLVSWRSPELNLQSSKGGDYRLQSSSLLNKKLKLKLKKKIHTNNTTGSTNSFIAVYNISSDYARTNCKDMWAHLRLQPAGLQAPLFWLPFEFSDKVLHKEAIQLEEELLKHYLSLSIPFQRLRLVVRC